MVLDAIAEFLKSQGVAVSGRSFAVSIKGHKFPQRELAVYGTRALFVIEELAPHLVLKREQALAILLDHRKPLLCA